MCHSASLAYACQNETLSISCQSDSIIKIINANFGRLGNELCANNIGQLNDECVSRGTRGIITPL